MQHGELAATIGNPAPDILEGGLVNRSNSQVALHSRASHMAKGKLGWWLAVSLGCFAWTVWTHLDTGTINYGLSRPGFWVDFLAWYMLCFCVICMLLSGVIRTSAILRQKRAYGIASVVLALGLWTVLSNGVIANVALRSHLPCWFQVHAGAGDDMGFLIALRGSIYPFELAHYSWTRAEYLKRRSNRSFDRWSERSATDFEKEQRKRNTCTNTLVRDVYRDLQHVAPTSAIHDDEDGIILVAAMYTAVAREGANIELWIDYHLRLGFNYVHLVLDWNDNAWDETAPYLAQWGHRVRVAKVAQNCSQGCAKQLMTRTYEGTTGWLAWIDADEFIYPMRWTGPLTFRRTLARLRDMGYCEIHAVHRSFGDSGYTERPASPLEAYISMQPPRWNGYGKSITWMPALDPTDSFQHEAKIRKTIPFCKYLKRGAVTQHLNLHLWQLPA